MGNFTLSASPIKPFVFEIYETNDSLERFVLRGPGTPAADSLPENKRGEFTVTFRQGTFGEDKQRSELFWGRKRVFETGKDTSVEVTNLTPQTLVENDIFITCCGIDGLKVEGIDIPEFIQAGSYKKVKDREQFMRFLEMLPSQWVDTLYAAVLEVNPKWDFKSK